MGFLMACYYGLAMLAFAILVNDIWVLRWHSWDAHLLGWIPHGLVLGWFEVIMLSALAGFSLIKMVEEIKKEAEKERLIDDGKKG